MKQKVCYIVIIGVIFFSGCKPDDVSSLKRRLNLPAEAALYNVPADDTFFVPYGDSIIDNDVATLGRVLFYDTQLSHNNRVSCGTCHKQQHGFSDNVAFSNGFENGLTGRNTQSIVNTGTQRGFFWDLRESTLDHMVLQPIANHVEMGIPDTLYMEEKVRRTAYYKPLFEAAFGSEEVTSKKMGRALAQFVKSIISVSSKFDKEECWWIRVACWAMEPIRLIFRTTQIWRTWANSFSSENSHVPNAMVVSIWMEVYLHQKTLVWTQTTQTME
jgi:hypothetical protein